MMPRFPINRPVLVAPPLLHLHAVGPRTARVTEPVSVLLPLRHEPSVALAAVRAAVAQRNVARLDVVVLDVGCTEETYRALNREYADDPRVRLLDTSCLPSGWSRTSHRAQQLAVGARGRILFFADPAAPLGPYAAAAGASLLRRQKLDLVVLDAGGSRRTGRFAVAADTEAYWRIGGHRAAAGDAHPLALLRAMRRAGAATGLADGRRVIPADTRAHAEDLPPEPRDQHFHVHRRDPRDNVDSTFGSLSMTARRLLAALRDTGADLVGLGEHPSQGQGDGQGQGHHYGHSHSHSHSHSGDEEAHERVRARDRVHLHALDRELGGAPHTMHDGHDARDAHDSRDLVEHERDGGAPHSMYEALGEGTMYEEELGENTMSEELVREMD